MKERGATKASLKGWEEGEVTSILMGGSGYWDTMKKKYRRNILEGGNVPRRGKIWKGLRIIGGKDESHAKTNESRGGTGEKGSEESVNVSPKRKNEE